MRISIAVLVVGALLLALALLWNPTARTRPAPAATPLAAAPIPAQPAAVVRQPTAVVPPAPTPASPTPSPALAPDKPAAPRSLQPWEVNQPPPSFAQQYAVMLASRFEADPPDPGNALERELTTRLGEFVPDGSRADPIECHKHLCRVRSFHPDRATYDGYVAAAYSEVDPDDRLWPGQTWIAVPADQPNAPAGEHVASAIYLERSAAP